jgi:PAS domain S-box-containing protein
LLIADVQDYAILLLDAGGHVATWNAGAQRLKGYRSEEIIGRHFSVFYAPEDVAAAKPERELMIAAAEGRLEDEGWRVRQDGTRFRANVVMTALRDRNGLLRGYGKITRDITERHNRIAREIADRKRAEELRQLNAEFGQHALATADLAQLKQQVVELVARTLEAPFVRLGELNAAGTAIVFSAGVGWPAHLIDDHSLDVAASECEESIRSGQPVFLGEGEDLDLLRSSHESRELGIVASATIPIRGKDAVAGVLHVGLREPRVFSQDDVTFLVDIGTIVGMVIDRDRRERRITRLNVDLQQRYAELETFTSSVAHDLRGPLRAIAGFAGALEEDYVSTLDEEALRFVGLIAKGADTMDNLIDALLSRARVSRTTREASRP